MNDLNKQREAFETSNNVKPDWSFKFDEELQQYIELDHEMQAQVEEINEHWDTFRAGWQAAQAQAAPETQQSQQDEIDSLIFQVADMKSRLNANYIAGQTSMYLTKQAEIDNLKAQLKAVHESRADFVEYCRVVEAQEPGND